uniref:DUF4817 domain-containing protein n=1 Tax=Acrobeloides nanus TaxID=290746 RepID=A0A914EBH6_9BILA
MLISLSDKMAFLEKTMHNFLDAKNFTNTHKANCVLWLAELHDISKVQKKFKEEFGDNPEIRTPSEAEILHWYGHFKNTGSFEHDYIVEEPKHIKEMKSQTKPEDCNHLELHTTSYKKDSGILNFFGFGKIHECHPYKMHLKKKFTAEDLVNRLEFAKAELIRIHSIEHFKQKMWFAGEATFYTNGRVETHNLVYLSEDPNQPDSKSAPSPTSECITVWAAFNARTILGPYIASGRAEKPTYHLFLKKFNFELKQLQRLEFRLYDPYFMHDDSPLHNDSMELLNEEFPDRWTGPGSSYATWPKLSPDMHPLYFFLWGYIKSKVYEQPIAPDGVTELSLRIHRSFTEILPEMLEAASKAYQERLKMVVINDGDLVDVHDDYENKHIQADIEAKSWMAD